MFVYLWNQLSPHLNLDADTRRIGDAMAIAAAEITATEYPPTSVLRAVFGWFAEKGNTFADEFTKAAGNSAGKTAGAALAVGGTAAATGQLPKLIDAIDRVLKLLG